MTSTNKEKLAADETKWLGSNVQMLRQQLSLTVKQVAEAVGIADSSLREIEKGKVASPSYVHVARLASLFGVTGHDMASTDLSDMPSNEMDMHFMREHFDDAGWRYLNGMVQTRRQELISQDQFK